MAWKLNLFTRSKVSFLNCTASFQQIFSGRAKLLMISRIPNFTPQPMLSLVFQHRFARWPACLSVWKLKPKKQPAILEGRIRIYGWESAQKCQCKGHVLQADLEDASLSSTAGHTLFRFDEIKLRDRSHPHNLPRFRFDNISHFRMQVLSSRDSYDSRISRKTENMKTCSKNKWKTNFWFWPFCGILPHTFKIFQETLSESRNSMLYSLTPCVGHLRFNLKDVVADKGCVDITVDVRSISELLSPWERGLGRLAMLPLAGCSTISNVV